MLFKDPRVVIVTKVPANSYSASCLRTPRRASLSRVDRGAGAGCRPCPAADFLQFTVSVGWQPREKRCSWIVV